MGRCSVTLKAPRRYGPSPLGLRATAFSRALTDWASTRWPVWVVRRCRKPTLRMAPFLRSASSSSSNATSTGQATPAGIAAGETLRRLLAAPCSGCSASGYVMRMKYFDVCVALGRLHVARKKIRTVLWRAWTHRSLTLSGTAGWPPRSDALAPLSHRDMWLLGRAARLARLANIAYGGLQRRCAGDCGCAYRWMSGVSTLAQMMKACPKKIGRTWRARPTTKNGFSEYTSHVRYVSNDELARRETCCPVHARWRHVRAVRSPPPAALRFRDALISDRVCVHVDHTRAPLVGRSVVMTD